MTDTVVLNAGSGGVTAATDDCAGVHYQVIKLADGTADATTVIAAGSGVKANALRVTLATDQLALTNALLVDGSAVTQPVSLASVPSHAVTNAGTFAVQAAQSGTWNVTNVSGTVSLPTGAATAAKQPALGTAGSASADVISVQGVASMTALKVDGSAVTQPVSASSLPLPTGASTAAKQPALGTAGSASSDVLTIQGIASMTKLLVTPDSVALPANQSVNLAQVGGTNTVNGGVAGSQSVGGTVATNVAITANPLNLGAQAVSSENAAVTTARQVQLVADLVGKLIVLPYANPENFVSGAITTAMTGTTSTSLIAAPASGLRNYITTLVVSNAHATVGTDIIIQDGSGGTTLMTIPAPAVYGGAVITLPVPLRQPTTATAIYCANVTTGASTKCSAVGYKGI